MQARDMRIFLKERYPKAAPRIDKMPDAQVIAFYYRVNTQKPKK